AGNGNNRITLGEGNDQATTGNGAGLLPLCRHRLRPARVPVARHLLGAAAKEAGYKIDWRQFSSGGDISTAHWDAVVSWRLRRIAAETGRKPGTAARRQLAVRAAPGWPPATIPDEA
ncbi:hypothetical protein VB636_02860, partial [Paracoccus sp. APAP_BH8]